MHEVTNINFMDKLLDIKIGHYFGETCTVPVRLEEVILMQSTGLKDKDGVEIYAWDIVKNHNTQEIGVVYYCQTGKWKITNSSWQLEYLLKGQFPSMDSGRKFGYLHSSRSNPYEFLGSYWEHTELIQN